MHKHSPFITISILLALIFVSTGQAKESQKKYSFGAPNNEFKKSHELYQLHCSPCHGEKGDGKGPLGEAFDPPPRNHQDAKIMSLRTDEDIFKVISEGGAARGFSDAMPPHNTILSEDEIRGLVKYVRKLCKCEYKK